MTTAIQPRNGSAPALALWNNADVALVKSMVADTATDDEFRLLIHLANKYELDPLAKQIYCIKYGQKPAAMFAGLAGFITIAERSGVYGGVQPEVWKDDEPLDVEYTYWENKQSRKGHYTRAYQWVAKATVWRTNAPHPFVAQVWESEYSSGQNLWVSKPRTMLQKVAMCQALRLAFSISGLYDRDEITDAPPVTVNTATGEIIDGTARELPPGRAVAAQDTPWSRAADVAIAHLHRLQVSPDDEKSLIMELTGGKARKLIEMHPPEIDRLSERLAQFQTPADLAALRAPGRAERPAETQQPSEAATDTPDAEYEAAVQAFKHNAALAGIAPEDQSAWVRDRFPNRKVKSLTTAEWQDLADKCRAMYSDVPAPEEAPIF